MTTIEVPPTWTPAPITRSIDHRYTYEGITYPGVTSIISIVGGSFEQASGWGAKMTAQAAVRLIPELPAMLEALGPLGVEKALKSRDSWGPDPSGSKLGTEVHEAISRFLGGNDMEWNANITQRLDHFKKWWNASGWKLRLSEAMVLHPDREGTGQGWGGTLDILAYDRDGRTVLADIKTGNIWPKVALQLAAYGMCTLVQPEGSTVVYPMPIADRYVTLHVTKGGCREIEMNVGVMETNAFLSALDIYHWTESMKGKRL